MLCFCPALFRRWHGPRVPDSALNPSLTLPRDGQWGLSIKLRVDGIGLMGGGVQTLLLCFSTFVIVSIDDR